MGKTVRVRSPLPAPFKQALEHAAYILLEKVIPSVNGHWYFRKKIRYIIMWSTAYDPLTIFYHVFISLVNDNLLISHGCGDENCFNPTHLIKVEYPVIVPQDIT